MGLITVQMTLDGKVLRVADNLARCPGTSRSSARHRVPVEQREKEQEQRTIAGYRRHPVKRGEFSVWHKHQVWGNNNG